MYARLSDANKMPTTRSVGGTSVTPKNVTWESTGRKTYIFRP